MPTTIIKHIQGREIPVQWIKGLKESPDQVYTVIIRPEGRSAKLGGESSIRQRNRIFQMLEGNSGQESSEEWIERIKSSRTVSPLKANFE